MSRIAVIPTLLDTLPFHEALNWERFQKLCTDLLSKRHRVVDSREYLTQGNAQEGIDVYAVERGEEKILVAQCKLIEYMGPKQVLDIIDEFLRGSVVKNTKEFILCTSADLQRQRDEEKTIMQARKKLSKSEIDFIVWDERGLSRELRINPAPDIVYHYFGEIITLGFYGDFWKAYVKKLHKVKKRSYRVPLDYIERKIISYTENVNNKKKNGRNYWERNEGETLVNLLEKAENEQSKRIVLLSTAGFGKTEEINNAAGYFSAEEKIAYPIKFSLRDYEGQPIETILNNYHSDWKNIKEEDMLLLFDGLDEVSEKYFQCFINHLNSFVENNSKSRIVVSSRYNFYDIAHFPQLREFEIFLLDPLTSKDIEVYIDKHLKNRRSEFEQILAEQKFIDYLQNPYYLTRLVRFYNDKDLKFPKNTSELFDRILFEQLKKDKGVYNIPDLKEKLFSIASEIAFCMTLAGKSALTDDEISLIVFDTETRKLLKHFRILNRNASTLGSWTFEHKNLQEYLCASILSNCSFIEIHKIISFEYNTNKLLPRFLNTISFLFEKLNNNSDLFKELFHWINQNEPEILVRFEKEQLSKETRHEIFYRILEYYKEKRITIRISPNFSYEELAAFIEIDLDIINYLEAEFLCGLQSVLAYDALRILGYCKKYFLYRDKIQNLLFSILRDERYIDYVKAEAIKALIIFQFTDESTFEEVLKMVRDLENREIRQACILFLNNCNYYEKYSKFLLNSIELLQKENSKQNIGGSYIILKQVVLKFYSPQVIKQLLQYCITNKNCISKYVHYNKFHFELKEVKILLAKAEETYKEDKTIVPIIYRLFCRLEYISNYQDWFQPFYLFFKNTCGTKIIFKKFYKYGKKDRDIMSFADIDCCNFLIEEFETKNIDENELKSYRNFLSHINHPLFLIFYEKLLLLHKKTFIIEDINNNYNEIRIQQKEKNQLMLLDQSLFLKEARKIFLMIGKQKVTVSDLWISENIDLRIFDGSIVYEAIRNSCIHGQSKVITKNEFLQRFKDDIEWEGFVIDSIVELLKEKDSQLLPALKQKINSWCIKKIQSLNFESSIVDKGNFFCYAPAIEFVKDVFLLLDLDLDDNLYLKMLPSDYESFYSGDQDDSKTISSVIISKVNDKELFKNTVLNNIKNKNLAVLVLCNHFSICHKMNYRECIYYLYQTIISNLLLAPHVKIKLTGYYLDLGGEIYDFKQFLKIPIINKEEELYSSWDWFLIEKMINIEPEAEKILLKILEDPMQSLNKLKAAKHLIQIGKIEGLEYWANYIKETKVIPFEHQWSSFQNHIADLPPTQAINTFISVLKFYFQNNLHNLFKGSLLIDESVFSSLVTISNINFKYYTYIKQELYKIENNFTDSAIIDSLSYFSERLSQRYYENQKQEIDIKSAKLIFNSIR